MVVVVLTAGGALLALRAYNSTKQHDPLKLERVLFSIKQQAGVMAAICTAIFGVISALQSGKFFGGSSGEATSLSGMKFGRPSSERAEQPA